MRSVIVASVIAVAVTHPHGPAAAETSEPIVVTATRTARSVDETLAPVTIITREEIERSTARDLTELLQGRPGIDIVRNGAYGKNTALFLRGTDPDQVLTLVDGVKQFSATAGTTAFQFIPLEQIERIEIVRGPRSGLWGSEAIGGVVHIFTRRGTDEAAYNASGGYGSHRTAQITAGVSGPLGETRYSVQAGYFDSDGIDAQQGGNPDDDGYDNASLSASLRHGFGNGAELDVGLLRAAGNTEYDSSFDPPQATHDTDFVQQSAHARLRMVATDAWVTTLQLGQSRDEADDFTSGQRVSRFDTRRDQLSWQNDVQLRDGQLLTMGVDYADDRVDSTVAYDVSERDNVGVFAQWQGGFEHTDAALRLRYDDNEQFGTETTGGIDLGWRINERLRLIGAYGSGFKAPTFNDLYFPGFSNPDLDPERSDAVEVALTGDVSWGRWAVRAFRSTIDDLITFDAATSVPVNVDSAEIDGLELELEARVADWTATAFATLLDPRDDATGNVLPRRAKKYGRLDVGRRLGPVQLDLGLVAQGRRFDDLANTVELDGYALLNARLGYALTKTLLIEALLDNLLDEDYETVAGFNEKGRTAFVRLRLRSR